MELLNELRIGNYVTFVSQVVRIVEVRRKTAVIELRDGNELETKDIFPLELTPAIVSGFGFESYSNGIYTPDGKFYHFHFKILPGLKGHNFEATFYPDERPFARYKVDSKAASKELNYVHQLQNMYYAVTRRELQFWVPAK